MEEVLEEMAYPEYVGCDILRYMVVYPQWFDVRKGLAQSAIRGFFTVLWEGNKKLRLVVEGKPSWQERAILHIKTNDECNNMGYAPLIRPGVHHNVYVLHIQAVKWMREELGGFMAEQNEKVDADDIKHTMIQASENYIRRISWIFARGWPVYEVRIV